MTDIKTKVQGIDPNSHARNIRGMASKTGNIYEAICVISARARQLAVKLSFYANLKLTCPS